MIARLTVLLALFNHAHIAARLAAALGRRSSWRNQEKRPRGPIRPSAKERPSGYLSGQSFDRWRHSFPFDQTSCLSQKNVTYEPIVPIWSDVSAFQFPQALSQFQSPVQLQPCLLTLLELVLGHSEHEGSWQVSLLAWLSKYRSHEVHCRFEVPCAVLSQTLPELGVVEVNVPLAMANGQLCPPGDDSKIDVLGLQQ